MADSTTKKPVNKQSIFSWAISEEELKNQVENYHTLPFAETSRGAAIIFVLCLLALSVALAIFGGGPSDSGTVIEWLIYCVALYFIYRGHRWAIILIMILWTADKGYQLYQISSSGQGDAILSIFWWLILMPYLYKALKIENARRITPMPANREGIFCSHCGRRQDRDAKFCASCGEVLDSIS